MRVLVSITCVIGCGRIHFDPQTHSSDDATAGEAAVVDAAEIPGLLVWYPLDEASFDGMALDATGGGRHALCAAGASCPAAVAGRIGGGAEFDGAASRLRTPYDAALNTTGGFTVAAHVFITNFTSFNSIASKPVGTGTGNSWQLQLPSTLSLELKLTTSAGEERVGAPIATGRWVHAAGTWDGAIARVYVDGDELAQLAVPVPLWDTSALLVGADENGGTLAGVFDGIIDDVRLYDRALAREEIAQLALP